MPASSAQSHARRSSIDSVAALHHAVRVGAPRDAPSGERGACGPCARPSPVPSRMSGGVVEQRRAAVGRRRAPAAGGPRSPSAAGGPAGDRLHAGDDRRRVDRGRRAPLHRPVRSAAEHGHRRRRRVREGHAAQEVAELRHRRPPRAGRARATSPTATVSTPSAARGRRRASRRRCARAPAFAGR